MKFRNLKPEEIDVKVGSVTGNGCTLLLYKNARVDMAILDDTVGAENWQRDHKEVKGNLYCGIGININYNTDKEPYYIWKWDCGVESQFGDKEKGEASDSFKRAGFNWGIGRELYTSPFIFIQCDTEYDVNKKVYKIKRIEDRNAIADLRVADIECNDNNEIVKLVITDKFGNVAFTTDKKSKQDEPIIGGDYVFRNGKYKDKTIAEVEKIDSQYLDWLLANEKVSQSIKDNINVFRGC